MKPIAVELFCGAGGFGLGMEKAGFDVRVAVENNHDHAATYRKNFHAEVINQSIRDVSLEMIFTSANTTEIDCVFGSPPCQDFSIQGKRDVEGDRGSLIWEFARIVEGIRPRYFILENVEGLMLGKAKEIFSALLEYFRNIGYKLSYRVLNACDFGVPQARKRLFLIGSRCGEKLPVFPTPLNTRVTVRCALADLPEVEDFPNLYEEDSLPYSLLQSPSSYVEKLNNNFTPLFLTGMQRTLHSDEVRERFQSTPPNEIDTVSRFKRLAWDGYSSTLKAGTGSERGRHTAARPIHPSSPRCITVREAARLQSFPDSFIFSPVKTTGYMQIGNSVPPIVAHAVGRAVMDAIS
jgi:DNA (cytosine-5)-methyltransferase 1